MTLKIRRRILLCHRQKSLLVLSLEFHELPDGISATDSSHQLPRVCKKKKKQKKISQNTRELPCQLCGAPIKLTETKNEEDRKGVGEKK